MSPPPHLASRKRTPPEVSAAKQISGDEMVDVQARLKESVQATQPLFSMEMKSKSERHVNHEGSEYAAICFVRSTLQGMSAELPGNREPRLEAKEEKDEEQQEEELDVDKNKLSYATLFQLAGIRNRYHFGTQMI